MFFNLSCLLRHIERAARINLIRDASCVHAHLSLREAKIWLRIMTLGQVPPTQNALELNGIDSKPSVTHASIIETCFTDYVTFDAPTAEHACIHDCASPSMVYYVIGSACGHTLPLEHPLKHSTPNCVPTPQSSLRPFENFCVDSVVSETLSRSHLFLAFATGSGVHQLR
jgi:hypothetical protein